MEWLTIPLLNSWLHFDLTSLGPAQYAKDNQGLVYFRGAIKSGTISTTVPFCILPPEFRPPAPYTLIFAVSSNDAFGTVRIVGLSGLVLPYSGNNTYVSLSNIVFSTLP
jgi:hypothetical protein